MGAAASLAVATWSFGATPAGGEASAVHVALAPDTVRVAPGAPFTLELRIEAAGKRFNAYDAVVAFDISAVAYESSDNPHDDEGDLMTLACGNTFHRATDRGDSLTISHVVLCGGVSLTGPGTLHRLHFRALDRSGATTIRLRRVQFYDAGIYVRPATTRDAVVIVSGAARVGDGATGLLVRPARPADVPFSDVAEIPSARWRWQG